MKSKQLPMNSEANSNYNVHLPDLTQNPSFKKSFLVRFMKDKKERMNSMVRNRKTN